jgi:hypothetical protein
MAHTSNLDEALLMWNSTNNTVGFNHMIGSASDKAAVVMETMKGFTGTPHTYSLLSTIYTLHSLSGMWNVEDYYYYYYYYYYYFCDRIVECGM